MSTPIQVRFLSQGVHCAADLYLPAGQNKPPVIVMAHGFATERTFGLQPFVERFVGAGSAVLTFDYRGFGESEGEPRLLVSPQKHIQDIQAALAFIRSRDDVDHDTIVLWGSSYGGGHCIAVAAQDPNLRGVIIQVPHVDAWQTMRNLGWRYVLQAAGHGLVDLLSPRDHYVKVISHPNEFAVMNTPESYPGYTAIVPNLERWENCCQPTSLLLFASYRPIQEIRKVACPILAIGAERDTLIDIRSLRKLPKLNAQVSLVEFPVGHFDIYHGEWFQEVIVQELAFIMRFFESKT